MPRPISSLLVKPSSADCNLACEYCFYLKKSALYPDETIHRMSEEVLEAMVRQVMELRRPNFSFGWQGGEPTLMGISFYEKAVEFMKRYGGPGQAIGNGLQTNGILIDDAWGDFLSEYNFLVGLSLDGPAQYHNRFRKTGGGGETHARVMQTVDTLRRHGVEFNCLVVVNSLNVHDPDGVYDFFMANDLRHLQFIPTIERVPGGGAGELADFSPEPEDFGRFMIRIFERWMEDDPPTVSVRWFDNLVLHFAGQPTASCTMKPTCGDYLAIEHNGDVYPCDFFVEKQWRVGNLLQTHLRDMPEARTFQRFCKQKAELTTKCRKCRWLDLCYGGCTKDRLAISDDPKVPTQLCRGYKLFFDRTIDTFKRMGERHRLMSAPPPVVEPPAVDGGRSRTGTAPGGGGGSHAGTVPSGGGRRLPAAARGPSPRKIQRNDPCPCGSGKKYKKCCGKRA